eukprot:gb/GEZN01012661.1/.p1 GENE.gb/GEZN01012661.1/~~gb/GEZN01012661.1/.p1  ORF type:complete len:291 (-),score=31.15 gb/GEZN01012661.1/:139-1011(-)
MLPNPNRPPFVRQGAPFAFQSGRGRGERGGRGGRGQGPRGGYQHQHQHQRQQQFQQSGPRPPFPQSFLQFQQFQQAGPRFQHGGQAQQQMQQNQPQDQHMARGGTSSSGSNSDSVLPFIKRSFLDDPWATLLQSHQPAAAEEISQKDPKFQTGSASRLSKALLSMGNTDEDITDGSLKSMGTDAVASWLKENKFSQEIRDVMSVYSGQDLVALSELDITELLEGTTSEVKTEGSKLFSLIRAEIGQQDKPADGKSESSSICSNLTSDAAIEQPSKKTKLSDSSESLSLST